MRTFIAVPLPDECHLMLETIQGDLRSFGADVRWAAIPSIHLTLKFLGEIDRTMLPRLAEALNTSTGHGTFSLRIHGLGGFPDLRNPRVVWCGVEGEAEKLAELQKGVEKACENLGFPPEDRPFHPHLTLGRVQGKRNLQQLVEYIRIGSEIECIFTVDHFNIYRSVLTPHGAKYTILQELALR